MARIVNFADGAESETTPVIGNIIASGIKTYPDDATYEATEQGAPIDGNIYYNTTIDQLRYYADGAWITLVDVSTAQTLTNKSIDADNNTITNLEDDNIKAGAAIDVTKLHDASVDNTEFGYLDGVTSGIQSQLDSKIPNAEKGVANGVATLDVSGLVPASQLPSFVDDVEEYADFSSLPVTGETGKIYVTLDDNRTYRWTGSVYVEVGPASQANNNALIDGGDWSYDFAAGASQSYQQLSTTNNTGFSMGNLAQYKAYNFDPGASFTANDITIYWDDSTANTGQFVIEIVPIIGGTPGEPDESNVLATTSAIDASTIGVGSQTHSFVSPVALTSGTQYAVMFRVTSTGTGQLDFDEWGSAPSGSYEYASNDSGATWVPSNSFALRFEISGTLPDTIDLTLSSDAYVLQPGFQEDRNTIQAQTISFGTTEDIAYVVVNKDTDATTNLTVNKAAMASYAPGDDDLIIAYRWASGVEVGRKIFLKDEDSAPLEQGILGVPAAASGGGSGVGGINYVVNTDAEVDESGHEKYLDAAQPEPEDGVGAGAGFSIGRVNAVGQVLRGDWSFKISQTANNRQGQGVHVNLDTIDPRDTNSRLQVTFDYKNLDSNYTDGELRVFVYDVDNTTLIGAVENDDNGDINLHTGDGSTFVGFFDSTDSLNYRLLFHFATTTAVAWDMVYDNVLLGPVSFISATAQNVIETKILSADQSGNGVMSDLTFSNLEIGKTYTLRGKYRLFQDNGVAADVALIRIKNGATIIDEGGFQIRETVDISNDVLTVTLVQTFVATSNTVTSEVALAPSAAAGCFGDGTTTRSYVEIETRNDLSTNVVSNTQLTQSTTHVSAAGSANTAITALVTDIDFTEVMDIQGAWSGTQFTAPRDGSYSANGSIRITPSTALNLYAYVNGVQSKYIGAGPAATVHAFSWSGYLQKGDTLSIRSSVSMTLNSNVAFHWIEINSSPDFTSYGVTGEKNLVQTKILSADATSDGTMSDLTLSNLEVGRWYEILGNVRMTTDDGGSADSFVEVSVVHDSNNLTTRALNIAEVADTSSDSANYALSFIFQATAGTLTFVAASATANSYVNGDNTTSETYVQIIERNDLVETTKFS